MLPTCPYFGPHSSPADDDWHELPADWTGDPFGYLPEVHTPTEEELRLAAQYRNNDISGGYLTSQIACFRCPRPIEQHIRRREAFTQIEALASQAGIALPAALTKLVRSDDLVDRLRHNTIWLHPVPMLVPLPSSPEHLLLELFHEGQGCGYWSLVFAPDGSHVVAHHDDSLDIDSNYPDGFRKPAVSEFTFHKCADSFDKWLTIYFLDCRRTDEHYAELLRKYPGM